MRIAQVAFLAEAVPPKLKLHTRRHADESGK
jgi:hypothetical protein